jgi:hypothetical protein
MTKTLHWHSFVTIFNLWCIGLRMNRLALTGILSLGSLIPILHFCDPIMQVALFWVALQLAIQVSFGFVPNALKVATIASFVIVVINLIWRRAEHFTNKVCSAVSDCDVDNNDCQLNKKIETQLRDSASLAKEIEQYLLVNEPDERA